jgi:Flavoprotein
VTQPGRLLSVIACGAGPASQAGTPVRLAQQRGWKVQVVATPAGLGFIDVASIEALTGSAVRSAYRSPGEPRSAKADAVIVAPATYNTINKCALGISDTYALGILAEAVSLGIPVVVLPFVNTALASRRPFLRSVGQLREEGVRVLLGPGEFEPHAPGTGGNDIETFPWQLALDEVERLARAAQLGRRGPGCGVSGPVGG